MEWLKRLGNKAVFNSRGRIRRILGWLYVSIGGTMYPGGQYCDIRIFCSCHRCKSASARTRARSTMRPSRLSLYRFKVGSLALAAVDSHRFSARINRRWQNRHSQIRHWLLNRCVTAFEPNSVCRVWNDGRSRYRISCPNRWPCSISGPESRLVGPEKRNRRARLQPIFLWK